MTNVESQLNRQQVKIFDLLNIWSYSTMKVVMCGVYVLPRGMKSRPRKINLQTKGQPFINSS
jgi:hypothetical protein